MVEGEAVVADVHASAAAAWRLADGTRTEDEIAQAVAERFRVDASTVQSDLSALWEDLTSRDLLESHEEPMEPPAATPGQDAVTVYETPAVLGEQVLEVIAAVCASSRNNDGTFSCRAFGACQIAFN